MAVIIDSFTEGKRTVRGTPHPDFRVHEVVLAVPPEEIDSVRSEHRRWRQ